MNEKKYIFDEYDNVPRTMEEIEELIHENIDFDDLEEAFNDTVVYFEDLWNHLDEETKCNIYDHAFELKMDTVIKAEEEE